MAWDPNKQAVSDGFMSMRNVATWHNAAFRALSKSTTRDLTLDEVRRIARDHAESIFASYGQLETIIKHHEATLERRWTQKARNKREQILLEAWPGMAAVHRPDFAVFRAAQLPHQPRASKSASEISDAYRFPTVNLEDLSKTRPLLLMLSARGRNRPDVFAMADHKAMTLGYLAGAIDAPFIDRHSMLLVGQKTAKSYGALVSWSDEPAAEQWLLDALAFGVGLGLEVLANQDRLMKFLLRCCALILHDVDLGAVHLSPQWQTIAGTEKAAQPPTEQQTATLTPSALPTTPLRSIIEQSNEAAYGAPLPIDLAWMESLVAAKLESSRDHLVNLREDPSYFAYHMGEYREHRMELLRDKDGKEHPTVHADGGSAFRVRVLRLLVVTSHGRVEIWKAVHEKVTDLQRLYALYSARLDPRQPLPRELLIAFLELRNRLRELSRGFARQIRNSLLASPPIRRFVVRQEAPANSGMDSPLFISAAFKPSESRESEAAEYLAFLFAQMADDDVCEACGLEYFVDELQHYLQRDKTADALISAYTADFIADLGIIAECLRQISRLQPWETGFIPANDRFKATVERDYATRLAGTRKFDFIISPLLASAADPTNRRKWYYPSDHRRTRETVDAMRKAEAHLDTIWARLDANILPVVNADDSLVGLRQLLGRRGSLKLQRTPPWQEEPVVVANDSSSTAALRRHMSPAELAQHYQDLELRSRVDDEADTANAPVRAKEKTRRAAVETPSDPAANATAVVTPTPARPPLPAFTVTQRSMKVFRMLFFTHDASFHPGDVPWKDFCAALGSVGLLPQKLHGSSWRFAPASDRDSECTDARLKGSILFHQPHPSPNLPFTVARFYGRRLSRDFGWHGGMFRVAKREQGEAE